MSNLIVATDLRVAGLGGTPLAVSDARPFLSWRFDGDRAPASVRVLVASEEASLREGRGDLWDSGTLDGALVGVAYGGEPIGSFTRAFWCVMVSDENGDGGTSGVAAWEVGPKEAKDWQGEWLAAESLEEARARTVEPRWVSAPFGPDRSREFRLTFEVAEHCDGTLVLASDATLDAVHLNGIALDVPFHHPAAFGPPPCVQAAVVLQSGENELLVRVRPAPGPIPRFNAAVAGQINWSSVGAWQAVAAGWTTRGATGQEWEVAADHRTERAFPWPAAPARLLRSEFVIDGHVLRARAYVAALGGYELRLNGRRAGDAELQGEPADYRQHVPYRAIDVTDVLRSGTNAIGVEVADGFYASYSSPIGRYAFGPAPRRVLVLMAIEYDDGRTAWVATDQSWRTCASSIVRSEIYDGERRDLRLEQPGWDQAGFDDSKWDRCSISDWPAAPIVAALAPPIKASRTIVPLSVRALRPDVHIVDFGQNFAGRARLRVAGVAGTSVVLRHAEMIDADGELDTSNLRAAAATDTFVLRDGSEQWLEPRFVYHGFRFIEVSGVRDLGVDDIAGVVLTSALPETGEFQSGSALVDGLWRNTLWSQRSNFVGIPTDCPQRDERLGWTGDAQIFWDTASFNMDVNAFTRSFSREMRLAQTAGGAFPMWAPYAPAGSPFTASPLPGWADAGVELPFRAFLHSGDRTIVDENWEAMIRYVDGVLDANPDAIWRNGRGIDLGDWLSLDAQNDWDETTPKVLIGTAMLAKSLDQLAQLAGWTGRGAEADKLRVQAARVADAFGAEFVRPDGSVGNGSHTSYILAVRLGLIPAGLRDAVGSKLAAAIRERGVLLTTGFLGTPLALDALADVGEVELAYSLLLRSDFPSWGYMVEKGATTIWERWNGDVGDVGMNSFNHYALGAVCAFLYRRVAGIEPIEPGFRRLRIAPLVDERLGHARARYESVRGTIESSWSIRGRDATFDIVVPAGAIAEITLPGAGVDGSLAHDEQRGMSKATVSSGAYQFKTTLPPS